MAELTVDVNVKFDETLEKIIGKRLSKRGNNWLRFSIDVLTHIETYTIPQYGDKPDDQIEEWSIEDCFKAVKKRMARFGRNSRGNQQELDFLKMVHELQIAFEKYEESKTLCEENAGRDIQKSKNYTIGNVINEPTYQSNTK